MPQLRKNLNQLLHSQLFLTENIDPKNYFDFVSLAVWFFVYQNMHKNVCVYCDLNDAFSYNRLPNDFLIQNLIIDEMKIINYLINWFH